MRRFFQEVVPERKAPDHSLQGGNARLILFEQIGGLDLVIELVALILLNPNADQIATNVVALGQPVQAHFTG